MGKASREGGCCCWLVNSSKLCSDCSGNRSLCVVFPRFDLNLQTSRKTEAVATEAAARSKRARKAPAVADDLEQQQVQHVTEPSAGRRRATKNHSASTEAPAATAGTARKPARSKAATAAAAAQQADEEAQPEPYTKAGKGPKATAAAAAKKPAAKRKASAPAAAKEKPPYYLVKSEPDEFSIDALKARPNQTEGWEGEGATRSGAESMAAKRVSHLAVQRSQSPYLFSSCRQ